MTCETCQHMKRIRAALAPCQSCDCGSHHGASHVQANDYTLSQRIAKDDDGGACRASRVPENVTTLPQQVEDRMRRFLASLFSLDPVDLLRVRSMVNGDSYADFDALLRDVAARVSAYSGRDSARAYKARKRIAAAVPELMAIFVRSPQEARKRASEREERETINPSSGTRGREDGRKAGLL